MAAAEVIGPLTFEERQLAYVEWIAYRLSWLCQRLASVSEGVLEAKAYFHHGSVLLPAMLCW